MSDDTKAALERAVDAHFADEFPGARTGEWVLQAFGQHIEDNNSYYLREWPEGQAVHRTLGLFEYGTHGHKMYMDRTNIVDDDDDDE